MTQLILNGGIALPETSKDKYRCYPSILNQQVEMISGRLVEEYVQEDVNGFIYQVREAVRCIGAGLLESPTVPHSMTLECCRVFEQVLGA